MTHRTRLHRDLRTGGLFESLSGTCLFCMLNPSTARCCCPQCAPPEMRGQDANDPTVRKVMEFSRRWGYARAVVVNAFSLMATDPKALKPAGEEWAIGPGNDEAILGEARRADRIVAAWGTDGELFGRGARVLDMLAGVGPVWRLGEATKDGYPRHPLYVPYSVGLERAA